MYLGGQARQDERQERCRECERPVKLGTIRFELDALAGITEGRGVGREHNGGIDPGGEFGLVSASQVREALDIVGAFEPVVVAGEETLHRFLRGLLAMVDRRIEMAIGRRGDLARRVEIVAGLDEPGSHELPLHLIHKGGDRVQKSRSPAKRAPCASDPPPRGS